MKCVVLTWVLLVPWLRFYGPPRPIWVERLVARERISILSENGQVLVTFKNDGVRQHFRFLNGTTGHLLSGSLDVANAESEPLGVLSSSGRYFATVDNTLQINEKSLVVREIFSALEKPRILLFSHIVPGPPFTRIGESISNWC